MVKELVNNIIMKPLVPTLKEYDADCQFNYTAKSPYEKIFHNKLALSKQPEDDWLAEYERTISNLSICAFFAQTRDHNPIRFGWKEIWQVLGWVLISVWDIPIKLHENPWALQGQYRVSEALIKASLSNSRLRSLPKPMQEMMSNWWLCLEWNYYKACLDSHIRTTLKSAIL